MFDPEIEAIAKSYDLFKVLEDDSKIRVIHWLISKFHLSPQPLEWAQHQEQALEKKDTIKILANGNIDMGALNDGGVIISSSSEKLLENYEMLADFFSDASPKTDWEKALVVATYLQIKKGLSDFSGLEVNKELKDLGYASSNITDAFDVCINKKPQLILQLRKEGNSKQARKKYKVSNEGIKLVRTMLNKLNNES